MNRSLTSIISIIAILVIVVMIVKALMDIIATGGTGYQYLEQGLAAGMLAALVMGIFLGCVVAVRMTIPFTFLEWGNFGPYGNRHHRVRCRSVRF